MNFIKSAGVVFVHSLLVSSAYAAPLHIPRAGGLSASFGDLPKPIVSPYYVYFGNSKTKKLPDAFDAPLNMKAVTVGFASAPKGKCTLDNDLNGLVTEVNDFIKKGGAVSLSFGGNLQDQTNPRQHVQQACKDVDGLVKLIEGAMKQFSTHNIEFDIEDNSLLTDKDAAKRLAQALVQVKKDSPDTFVTYTVGSNTKGMSGDQITWVQAAKDNGLTIDALTLMTMNMGGDNNVKDSQSAITGGAGQLMKIYSLKADEAMKKMGMLPAIGVDNNGKVIDLKGIATLAQFVKSNSMSIMSYWNFNRDFPGDADSKTQSLNDSSSPDQEDDSQFFTTIQGAINDGGDDASDTAGKIKAAGGIGAVTPSVTSAQSDTKPGQKDSLPAPNPNNAPGAALN